jgi:hypothetical protein
MGSSGGSSSHQQCASTLTAPQCIGASQRAQRRLSSEVGLAAAGKSFIYKEILAGP